MSNDYGRSYLEEIREAKKRYDSDILYEIADELEDILGPAEMWNTLRPGFTLDELFENLEYIAREHDL